MFTSPANVTVKRGNQKAVIRWRAVPGATSYVVKVGKTAKPSFTLKKLKPSSRARVKFTAVNSAGSSPVVTVRVRSKR